LWSSYIEKCYFYSNNALTYRGHKCAGFPTILHGTFSTLNKSGGDVRTFQFSFLKEMDRRWQMAQRDAENRLRDSQAASQGRGRGSVKRPKVLQKSNVQNHNMKRLRDGVTVS
jgi:hypothetical protein